MYSSTSLLPKLALANERQKEEAVWEGLAKGCLSSADSFGQVVRSSVATRGVWIGSGAANGWFPGPFQPAHLVFLDSV